MTLPRKFQPSDEDSEESFSDDDVGGVPSRDNWDQDGELDDEDDNNGNNPSGKSAKQELEELMHQENMAVLRWRKIAAILLAITAAFVITTTYVTVRGDDESTFVATVRELDLVRQHTIFCTDAYCFFDPCVSSPSSVLWGITCSKNPLTTSTTYPRVSAPWRT
jgi:hypothetical protein